MMTGEERDALELLVDRIAQDTDEEREDDLHAFFCLAWPTADAQNN